MRSQVLQAIRVNSKGKNSEVSFELNFNNIQKRNIGQVLG